MQWPLLLHKIAFAWSKWRGHDMAMICFASQKGAPGTTLSTLAIAAAWPTSAGRRKLVVEADPSGGVLALRYGLGLEPGLVTLAVAVRTGLKDRAMWEHAQELPGGLAAIVGPDSPDRATSVLSTAGPALARWLAAVDNLDVFVDVGRLDPGGTASTFVRAADLALMVARPTAEQLQPAAQRMRALSVEQPRLAWLLIGNKPYSAHEVEATFGYAVAGVIADDRRGAHALEHGAQAHRVRRSGLARSATGVAESLVVNLNASGASGSSKRPLVDLVATGQAGPNGASHDG